MSKMQKRILVIENDAFIQALLSDLLTRFGYCVTRVQSGAEALEMIHRESFDTILLDIHLYDMDGKVIYQKVKERSEEVARKIVFVTGDLGNPETAVFIKETGNLSLQKPFTITEIKELLKKFFQVKDQ